MENEPNLGPGTHYRIPVKRPLAPGEIDGRDQKFPRHFGALTRLN